MGSYEEAIAAWDRTIELEPDEFYSGSKWEMKGKVLEILGRNDESARAYERALELVDKSVTKCKTSTDLNLSVAWASMADILADHFGRYNDSIEAYNNSPEYIMKGELWKSYTFRVSAVNREGNESEMSDPVGIVVTP